MIEAAPNDRWLQLNLAGARYHISHLHVTLGHREQALAGFEEVVARGRALAHADPSDMLPRNSWWSLCTPTALCWRIWAVRRRPWPLTKRPGRSSSGCCARSIPANPYGKDFRAWNAELISNFHRRRDAGRLASRGLALARSGHPAEAVTAYRQAIKVLEGLEADPGHGVGCAPAIKPTLDPYHLACDHARLAELAGAADSGLSAAEGPAERDRALECLPAAVAAGFRDLARIRTDTDLDPLRVRPDFQLLMMDLAFPDDPFAARFSSDPLRSLRQRGKDESHGDNLKTDGVAHVTSQ